MANTKLLDSKLKLFISKKEAIFARVTNLYDSSTKISTFDSRTNQKFLQDSESINELHVKFESIVDEINEIQLEIDPEHTVNYSSLIAFEDLYSSVKFVRNKLLNSKTFSDNNSPNTSCHIKLPPIELPSFDGKAENWPIFYEIFRSNVHQNAQLTDSQRVQYLISRLTHSALKMTAGIVPTGETYKILWDSLVKKYQDKRTLGVHYVNNILDTKNCVGSAASLSSFIEKLSASIAALKQLNIKDLSDFIILQCSLRKIDSQTLQSFEISVGDKEIPTCDQLISFIQDRVKMLERTRNTSTTTAPEPRKNTNNNREFPQNKTYKSFVSSNEWSSRDQCVLCKADHKLFSCSQFRDTFNPQKRFDFIKSKGGCVNCLSISHTVRKCNSQHTCNHCGKQHHSLLHFDSPPPTRTQVLPSTSALSQTQNSGADAAPQCTVGCSSTTPTQNNKNASITLTSEIKPSSTILLSTAQVYASRHGSKQKDIVRCLIDNGSQNNLITLDCCNRLNFPVSKMHNSYLQGVGMTSQPVHGYAYLDIESRINPNNKYYIHALVVDCITDRLPAHYIQITEDVTYLNNIPLADLSWNIPGEIDVVLGVQLFSRIYLGDKVESGSRAPPAILTSFGYILMGDILCHSNSTPPQSATFFTAHSQNEIESSLHKFFELEEVPTKNILSPEEVECENIFTATVKYQNKHYSVDLPFCKDPSELGDSRSMAHRRFLALERKFNKIDGLRNNYNQTMNDYVQQGYLSVVPELELLEEGYYIPHHAVFKRGKDSARAVLDASAKTQSGLSLNDILHVGPNLQSNLFLLLIDFRLFPIAVTADVKQMFLRIGINEHHRKYLRILFRFNSNEPIRTYQFNSLPFGLKSSPFIAMRTIRKLAYDFSDRFPMAADLVDTQFFMDDFVHSFPDEQTANKLSHDLIELFKLGSFDLIKWTSNSSSLLEALPDSHRSPVSFSDSESNNYRILGLSWEPADDMFSFTTQEVDSNCTKRSILSLVARLFDTLGLVAPVVLLAKILIKELWLSKIDWDEVPPESIRKRFAAFALDFPILSSLSIPRHIGVHLECEVNIVAFCDASFSGYGSCIYLHITDPAGNIAVRLLCAKSKVSPNKIQTLARLELVAALLLSKLVRVVKERIADRIPIAEIYAFSDSTVALSWIHSSPHRWSIFVSNRVAKIHENLSPACFHHVSGKENPSDCLSRGMLPSQLASHSLWWDGPVWLQKPVKEWPIDAFSPLQCETLPEYKAKSSTLITSAPSDPPLLNQISNRAYSWSKLINIFIYILKFTKRLTNNNLVANTIASETFIIKAVQKVHFANEIQLLKAGDLPSKYLRNLSPFLDSEGVLRIGGRLSKSDLPFEVKHPALLPKRDRIIDLIIDHYHTTNCHTGPGLLISIIRQRFWVLNARSSIRSRCRQCNICFRLNPKHPTPKMADLPAYRIRDAKAFVHTGTDFAGPINFIPTRRRGQHAQRAYICLFICLVTKAIHIELVSSLTSDAFLSAFKRFISRRGPVSVIYSDNGTNFVGAKAQLDEIYDFLLCSELQESIKLELIKNRIEWKRIPPRAAHFGGIWESNIKSIKTHMHRVVGKQLLTYEELLTVLVQIECILNSRPLVAISADPHPDILTPAHFLMSTPLRYLPSSELKDEKMSLTNRKKLLDQLVLSYWNKWRLEYLHTLQVRQKWCTPERSVELGTVVLVGKDNVPPLHWLLGVIIEVFPGSDGIVRVASVKTRSGIYKRPVTKLYPLPTQ